jgi:hypothetical protein
MVLFMFTCMFYVYLIIVDGGGGSGLQQQGAGGGEKEGECSQRAFSAHQDFSSTWWLAN